MRRNAKSKLGMSLSVLLLILAVIGLVSVPKSADAKYSALIMEDATGKILHSRNIDTLRHPASLTKIMTLYMTFEALRDGRLTMGQQLTVSRHASRMPSSKLGLGRGEKISVRDAIMSLITKSANDVAVVVAEGIAGTEAKFAEKMTAKARSLGMTRTTFRNASGLYSKTQKSTARDMATLAHRIMHDFPEYYGLFDTKSFTYRGRKHKNHNNLLGRYTGTDGIKTGYIGAAGFNLVASVTRHNVRLIGVVFGGRTSKSRDRKMMALLDSAFLGYEAVAIRAPRKPDMPALGETQVAASGAKNPFLKRVNSALSIAAQAAEPPRAPVPTASAQPAAEPMGEWSIQVGAFRSRSRAHGAAETAQSRLGSVVEASMIAVVPTRGTRTLYRARIAGLQKQDAFAACNNMKQRRQDCLVLGPKNAPQLAERQ
ncbi:D-alanyl-D-alanine carboxypeptidase [Hwanghaeella grinnelliae]|uniref:D-alanyl-D-alanine carboxypeptidase n=1 Tax=Hwanghaeella grinnelliae TaxID=2500179 RepID=A0A437QVB7_9PROT|nr:serine hydrolase [Hwanghaeella grinnelliae]RVU38452.1 D-alanyl-D-alanine carboxypeptidase [Hwanghaeella grinnelliae]